MIDLRKRYNSNNDKNIDKSPFIIRIREDGDIVYYNGIKAFSITKSGKIKIFDNIYKLNKTNLEHYYKDNTKYNVKENLLYLRQSLSDYFEIALEKIEIEISKNNLDNYRLNNLKNDIKDYILKEEYRLDNNKDKLIIYLKNKLSFETMLDIEEKTLNNLIFTNNVYDKKSGYSKPEIYYKLEEKVRINKNIQTLEKFEKLIMDAVKSYNYNTDIEVEKTYQHQFMISDSLAEKGIDDFNVYRFEEEYYTPKMEQAKRGRIDNVFLRLDDNSCEPYFIELKVDSKVVGGTNGIHKHLYDMEKTLIYGQEIFFNELKNAVDYRLNANTNFKKENNNYKCKYYVVTAFTNEDEKEKVKQFFKIFKTEKNIDLENRKKWKINKNFKTIENYQLNLSNYGCEVIYLFDNWGVLDGDLNTSRFITLEEFLSDKN